MPSRRPKSHRAATKREGGRSPGKADQGLLQTLLMEVGVEEIPSDVIALALRQLGEAATARFTSLAIPFDPPQVYGTPRRLVLYLPRLAPRQESRTEIVIGPPKKAGFNAEGKPTTAAIGFAKSQGVSVPELTVRTTEKGEYLSVEREIRGEATSLLLRKILPEMISSLTFPRAMRWNGEGVSFVRPIRWIAAIYGGKVIPFSYAGVKSGGTSYGHRVLAPGPFPVRDFASYRKELSRRFVLIDPKERYDLIRTEMERLAGEKQGEVEEDETLLWQAAFTVEYPKAICGAFDPPFLEVPKEIVITAMKEHQGYFPLHAPNGKLLPAFITILNNPSKKSEIIRKGNERVLRARLVDAAFYFNQDRKNRLADRVSELSRVTFQEKLGTLHEKIERLVSLSRSVGQGSGMELSQEIQRAAFLSKADLLTGVVREFPSLQGTMGRIYATLDGESEEVAAAIEEHYLPRFSGGALPKRPIGQVLAVADKLDTIVGCFGVGLIPSGSEDPYALRRQGLGMIQILVAEGTALRNLSVETVLLESIRLYEAQRKFSAGGVMKEVIGFLKQRVASHLQTEGIRYDLIDAVLARKLDRPHVMVDCARALARFSTNPLFGPLLTGFKRAIRIVPKGFAEGIDPSHFKEPVEKDLYDAISHIDGEIGIDWNQGRYETILETLATLSVPLNRFFEGVLVMDPDEAVRNNRLSLLLRVRTLFDEFSDFSKIVEGESLSSPKAH
ncbi:MAG: glycine--tRNA ligase subunit beta [Candidatus Manganitrophaceae bacterium]